MQGLVITERVSWRGSQRNTSVVSLCVSWEKELLVVCMYDVLTAPCSDSPTPPRQFFCCTTTEEKKRGKTKQNTRSWFVRRSHYWGRAFCFRTKNPLRTEFMGFDVDTLAEKPLRRWNEKDTVRGDDDVCGVAVTGGTRFLLHKSETVQFEKDNERQRTKGKYTTTNETIVVCLSWMASENQRFFGRRAVRWRSWNTNALNRGARLNLLPENISLDAAVHPIKITDIKRDVHFQHHHR